MLVLRVEEDDGWSEGIGLTLKKTHKQPYGNNLDRLALELQWLLGLDVDVGSAVFGQLCGFVERRLKKPPTAGTALQEVWLCV